MKKTFIITMFGEPFSWIEEYITNVQHLAQYGWEWKIFTPAQIQSRGNVEIVPMNTDGFNQLVEEKLGVRPNFYITEQGRPSVHITDYYVASGVIFADWLSSSHFWGITNLDVVYGRLDHFIPDSLLEQSDAFTDDVNRTCNGVFSLFKNTLPMNNLFREIPHWQEIFAQPPCPKCIGTGDEHVLYGTDEYSMTEIFRAKDNLKITCPVHFPIHSHDRLEQHVPDVKLEIMPDGSLWELFQDTGVPDWEHARPFIGREIPYFHFIRTKEWPKSLKK